MRFAQREDKRILPNPLVKDAICPLCKSEVFGKCGEIKVWHWAHKAIEDCDSFSEGETEWHINWKKNFPEDCQEVIVGEHRADVKIKDIVIEFQNSHISKEDIEKRENFYEKMKWVLNGETLGKNIELFDKKEFFKFKWKWFPKSWFYSTKPIYIDCKHLENYYLDKMNNIYKNSEDGKYYKSKKVTYWEEYTDGNTYPKTESFGYYVDIEKETNFYWDLAQKFKNKLFLIKKLSNEGTGWGKLISKENFIKECEYGYYRD